MGVQCRTSRNLKDCQSTSMFHTDKLHPAISLSDNQPGICGAQGQKPGQRLARTRVISAHVGYLPGAADTALNFRMQKNGWDINIITINGIPKDGYC